MSSRSPETATSHLDVGKCVVCKRTLHNPRLLTCLHNVCSSCSGDAQQNPVTCCICQVTTGCSEMPLNFVISTLLQHCEALEGFNYCGPCKDEEIAGSVAYSWCYDCQKPLCSDCDRQHQKQIRGHKRFVIDAEAVPTELYRTPIRECKEHSVELNAACFTCRGAKCIICALECSKLAHDVVPFEDRVFTERLKKCLSEITDLLSSLNESSARCDLYTTLFASITNARKLDVKTLEDSKKRALDAIGRAYDNAALLLVNCYDNLESKASELCEAANSFKTRICVATDYCEVAVKSSDTVGFLAQLSVISNSLKTLQDQAEQLKEPVDPSKLVGGKVCLPRDLDSIVSGWLGEPKLISDNLCCSESELSLLTGHSDYNSTKAATLEELKARLEQLKEEQQLIQLQEQEHEGQKQPHTAERTQNLSVRLRELCPVLMDKLDLVTINETVDRLIAHGLLPIAEREHIAVLRTRTEKARELIYFLLKSGSHAIEYFAEVLRSPYVNRSDLAALLFSAQ